MRVLGLVVFFGLIGCTGGANVMVDTSVPTPLVDPIPVTMGVYFDDALTQYVHTEELEYYGNYRIEVGASQIPVFNRVFNAMFQKVVLVDSVTGHGKDVDAVLVPAIEEFQFSIPEQTRSEFYEVWIKYKIEVFNPTGELIASMPLLAYGKANSRNYGFMEKTKEPALNEATTWALRDAAAYLAFYFRSQSDVKAWLETTVNAT